MCTAGRGRVRIETKEMVHRESGRDRATRFGTNQYGHGLVRTLSMAPPGGGLRGCGHTTSTETRANPICPVKIGSTLARQYDALLLLRQDEVLFPIS